MIQKARMGNRIASALILISALAWSILLMQHLSLSHSIHSHHGTASNTIFTEKLIAWGLMLVAMMTPTLSAPLLHVWERSFKRVRTRSMAIFIAGYLAIWLLAGAAILQIIAMPPWFSQNSILLPFLIFALALIWQCSPLKQQCLNRGHNHVALRAFGWAAQFDALKFGARHGLWCLGSCWALMLLPMAIGSGHLVAMAIVTVLIITEKQTPPNVPDWRIRGHETVTALLNKQLLHPLKARH